MPDQTLATFNGGKLTISELEQEVAGVPPQVLEQLIEASDSSLNDVLKNQVTKELILAEARKRGVDLTPQEAHDIREQARKSILQIVQESGIAQLRAPEAPANNLGIAQQVRDLLQQAVMGQRQLPPLGIVGTELRNVYGSSINQAAVQQVVDRITQVRSIKQAAEQRILDDIRTAHPY